MDKIMIIALLFWNLLKIAAGAAITNTNLTDLLNNLNLVDTGKSVDAKPSMLSLKKLEVKPLDTSKQMKYLKPNTRIAINNTISDEISDSKLNKMIVNENKYLNPENLYKSKILINSMNHTTKNKFYYPVTTKNETFTSKSLEDNKYKSTICNVDTNNLNFENKDVEIGDLFKTDESDTVAKVELLMFFKNKTETISNMDYNSSIVDPNKLNLPEFQYIDGLNEIVQENNFTDDELSKFMSSKFEDGIQLDDIQLISDSTSIYKTNATLCNAIKEYDRNDNIGNETMTDDRDFLNEGIERLQSLVSKQAEDFRPKKHEKLEMAIQEMKYINKLYKRMLAENEGF